MFFQCELRAAPAATKGLQAFYSWLWSWAAGHPTLRKLACDEVDETDEAGLHGPHCQVESALRQLQLANPRLSVGTDDSFSEELDAAGEAAGE